MKPLAAASVGLAIFLTSLAGSYAEESSALVDILVRKGVITDAEAKEVRAELAKGKEGKKESDAAKIKLSDHVQELKLYGDLRLRYQWDSKDPQLDPPGVGVDFPLEERNPTGNQRSRWRFRLRLNADFKLAENIFGGVELSTSIASDSGNQTFENGFDDYPIFISKAYIGWSPGEWLTLTAGKVPNPFYTTELVWDADITPTGITETVHLHKLFWSNGGDTGLSKDGKGVASKPFDSPWELTLIAGQFIFDDNIEGGGSDIRGASRDNDETTDPYLFETQLLIGYKFSKDIKLTIAPAWLVYNAGSADGLENNNPFQDYELVSGATRNISLLLLPGDLSFRVAGIKTKLFWDFSYNLKGDKRVEETYRLGSKHRDEDNFAFLVGLQLGENKKQGDWSLVASYRRIGIGSIDPNLNDSDFADSELNMQGFRIGLVYSLTEFATFALTYQYAWQVRDLRGGEATEGNSIADANEVQTVQADVTVKF